MGFLIILQPVHKPRRDQDPDLRGRDGQGLGQGLSNPGLNNLENVTRVRLVQFQRNTDEPMGITLKLSEDGKKCFKFMPQPNLNEAQSQNFVTGKVEKILKDNLDLIPSPSVKIQIMGRKVCLRCKGKTLLGFVIKILKTNSLLTSPSNVFPNSLK